MVQEERPPSNYSSSDETKREQRCGFDNGHPQWSELAMSRVDQNKLSDMQRASASMHNAPQSLCLMHDCADARWEAGRSRVVVRVTGELLALRQSGMATF